MKAVWVFWISDASNENGRIYLNFILLKASSHWDCEWTTAAGSFAED